MSLSSWKIFTAVMVSQQICWSHDKDLSRRKSLGRDWQRKQIILFLKNHEDISRDLFQVAV